MSKPVFDLTTNRVDFIDRITSLQLSGTLDGTKAALIVALVQSLPTVEDLATKAKVSGQEKLSPQEWMAITEEQERRGFHGLSAARKAELGVSTYEECIKKMHDSLRTKMLKKLNEKEKMLREALPAEH